jgi:hypothetical protein
MREIMNALPDWVLISIGVGAIAVLGWMVRQLVHMLIAQIKQSLKESREAAKKEYQENKHEQEYDMYLLLRGMQVVTDLEHELVYCVINGTHNGTLERANKELDQYRQLSNENLVKKASKWNIKIDN